VDYVCPYSARLYKRFTQEVWPWLEQTYPEKVTFILRHQVQPWHPSSTLTHEAVLAVERLNSEQFYSFSTILFEKQRDFFDESVVNQTRNQTYQKLLALAPVSLSDSSLQLLTVPTGEPHNAGNQVTNDLKWHVKFARQRSVHVSPTVFWDGVAENVVSSGWEVAQWQEWLKEKLE